MLAREVQALKGTAPNVSHRPAQSNARQRGAALKGTAPNVSHRPAQSNARQRGCSLERHCPPM